MCTFPPCSLSASSTTEVAAKVVCSAPQWRPLLLRQREGERGCTLYIVHVYMYMYVHVYMYMYVHVPGTYVLQA